MTEELIQIIVYAVGVVITAVITFFTTKHGLRSYTRDKFDELKTDYNAKFDKLNSELNTTKIELERLKGKDDLQQQVIDQVGNQMNTLIPKLLESIKIKNDA